MNLRKLKKTNLKRTPVCPGAVTWTQGKDKTNPSVSSSQMVVKDSSGLGRPLTYHGKAASAQTTLCQKGCELHPKLVVGPLVLAEQVQGFTHTHTHLATRAIEYL